MISRSVARIGLNSNFEESNRIAVESIAFSIERTIYKEILLLREF